MMRPSQIARDVLERNGAAESMTMHQAHKRWLALTDEAISLARQHMPEDAAHHVTSVLEGQRDRIAELEASQEQLRQLRIGDAARIYELTRTPARGRGDAAR